MGAPSRGYPSHTAWETQHDKIKRSLTTGHSGCHSTPLLLALLHHDDVIPKARLDPLKRGASDRAGRYLEGHLLELGVQRPLGLPAERTSCVKRVSMFVTSRVQSEEKNPPALALSSDISLATTSNFSPLFSRVMASSLLVNFSHCCKKKRRKKVRR